MTDPTEHTYVLNSRAYDGTMVSSYWGAPDGYDRHTVYTAYTNRPWSSPGSWKRMHFANFEYTDIDTNDKKYDALATVHRAAVLLYNDHLKGLGAA